jgi:hypothetical protein
MKIGITGTRMGMNESQFTLIEKFLQENFSEGSEFHHGDCVGVDAEAALLAKDIGYKIVGHPGPNHDNLRAFVESDETKEPLSHFKRNRNIVDTCDILMVVPLQNEWQPKGGTWYTHDYAVKQSKALKLFLPKG